MNYKVVLYGKVEFFFLFFRFCFVFNLNYSCTED